VKAAGDIGDMDRGHDARIVAEPPDAETLAHVPQLISTSSGSLYKKFVD
jgi:hypothetical protein